MNIFSTMAKTPYQYYRRTGGSTWSGNIKADVYSSFGVFKPRNISSLPNMMSNETAEPTLNIKVSEPFITRPNVKGMIGDEVVVPAVNGTRYKVVAVTTARNFRTNTIAHYRLHLAEVAQ